MACGVHLGILLICLVQAKHVRCLWTAQAPSSQGQSDNRYVSFSQQDSGLRRLGGSYPQNQLRQASVSSGYSQGPSSSGYKQTLSQPIPSGYPSVKLVQSSSISKPNWQTTQSTRANVQTFPKKQYFGLSTAIASGSSISKYGQNQKDTNDISKKRMWPIQQGTLGASKYLSSSSASVRSPSSKSYSFKSAFHSPTAQKAPNAVAETPAYYGPRGYSQPMSSSLFSAGAPVLQGRTVQVQTSASAPARRVSSRRSSKASKPFSFSPPQNARTLNNPSQAEAGKLYRSKLFPANGGNVQGRYQPTSTHNMASNHVSSSRSRPVPNKLNAPVGFPTRSLQVPTSQRLRFAPSITHSIPKRFGGYAIRRLKDPVHQKEVRVWKPQQTYAAPSQQSASHRPEVQSAHSESKWKRIRPHLQH